MQHNREYEILLLDYYGDLLTNHQKEILNDYYNEDLSMKEIADNLSISKAAIQDLIKRSLKQLENYEKVLKLIKKDEKINKVLDDMDKQKSSELDKYSKTLKKIIGG